MEGELLQLQLPALIGRVLKKIAARSVDQLGHLIIIITVVIIKFDFWIVRHQQSGVGGGILQCQLSYGDDKDKDKFHK